MSRINRSTYEKLRIKKPDCYNQTSTTPNIGTDIENVADEYKRIVSDGSRNILTSCSWLLDKDLWNQVETGALPTEMETLRRGSPSSSRGRSC
jgi:hypothetical protein